MLSIERRFEQMQTHNPFWSSIICFVNSVYGFGYPNRVIHKSFKKLVEKGDYAKREIKQIFKFLDKCSVKVKKEGKLPRGEKKSS